jgi:hypothetical protein
MNDEFIRRIYNTVVKEHIDIYKDLYSNTKINEKTTNFWKKAIKFYHELDDNNKDIFFEIMKVVIIDAVSEVFGIFDGSSTLQGGDLDISITIDGKDTENELQDSFLEYVENVED